MPKPNLTIIAWVVIAVLATVLLFVLFDKSSPNEKLIRSEIELENKEKELKLERDGRKQDRQMFDSVLSVITSQVDQKTSEVKTIIHRYENVPNVIRDYSRDSLRAAVKRYSLLPD